MARYLRIGGKSGGHMPATNPVINYLGVTPMSTKVKTRLLAATLFGAAET